MTEEDFRMGRTTQKLLTLMELEQITGRKVATWRKAIAQRRITFVRLGRSIRVPQEVLEDLIKNGWCDPVDHKQISGDQ